MAEPKSRYARKRADAIRNPLQAKEPSGLMSSSKKTTAKASTTTVAAAKTKAKTSEFGTAFASARKAGKATFEWKGKKYTTKMKAAAKKAPKPSPRAPRAGTKTAGGATRLVPGVA